MNIMRVLSKGPTKIMFGFRGPGYTSTFEDSINTINSNMEGFQISQGSIKDMQEQIKKNDSMIRILDSGDKQVGNLLDQNIMLEKAIEKRELDDRLKVVEKKLNIK